MRAGQIRKTVMWSEKERQGCARICGIRLQVRKKKRDNSQKEGNEKKTTKRMHRK